MGLIAIAVGDLNQSIYAFSGKSPKFLSELTQNQSFKYFRLDKNHRCHPSIINYSNFLLNERTELISIDDKEVFFFRVTGNEINIADWVDANIESIEKKFKVTNRNQIALLTRGNRTGEILNEHLKIPHRLYIANDLDNNLNIWSAIFSNLLYYFFDHNYKFIDVIEVFTSYDRLKNSQLRQLNKHKKNLELISHKQPIDEIKLKKEFIGIALIIAPNSQNVDSIKLLESILNCPNLVRSYKSASENEVNILTLHKSKGLEYEVVIHLDLYEWVFPNKQPDANGDFNNPVFGDWEQDLNLHYVGLTRAKKGCILISSTLRTNNSGQIKNAKDSEFLWLNNIEKLRYRKPDKP